MIMRIPLLRTVCKAIVAKADWDESKHPRADNGQFGSGSGGSSKPKKPSKTRRKMERREEAASQARVGGAIQSLLSGGSALDKIGWLNTSKKPEATKEPGKNPPHVDMGGVPKNKSLITGSVSVSYDHKIRNRTARFFGGEDSPSGEHVHSEDAEYTTVSNVENFIYVQTHDGRGGWYPDIYNNTRRTNYYPGSKEDALTDIAAHPGGPTVDELYPTLADAIASDRSIPKDYKISPHSNKPPKPFDGAAVLEEYYRNHPEKRPLEAKPKEEAAPAKEPSRQEVPKQPEKPKAEEKPKPADKVKSAKDTIQENLKSGKLKRETVIAAVRSLHEQANAAKSKGDFASSKDLNFQANIMIDAAGIKSHELLSSKGNTTRQNAPSQHTQRNPRDDPFAGDPLHDPLPRGYRVRSPEETERYMREHPYKPPKDEDYEQEYKRRTGRDFDPTIA